MLLVHSAINDLDLELLDLNLDLESCIFSGLGLEASGLGLDLAVDGLDYKSGEGSIFTVLCGRPLWMTPRAPTEPVLINAISGCDTGGVASVTSACLLFHLGIASTER